MHGEDRRLRQAPLRSRTIRRTRSGRVDPHKKAAARAAAKIGRDGNSHDLAATATRAHCHHEHYRPMTNIKYRTSGSQFAPSVWRRTALCRKRDDASALLLKRRGRPKRCGVHSRDPSARGIAWPFVLCAPIFVFVIGTPIFAQFGSWLHAPGTRHLEQAISETRLAPFAMVAHGNVSRDTYSKVALPCVACAKRGV